MANIQQGGLRLTVEQFSEFMQQTGQASDAMLQMGQSAQASAGQISDSFAGQAIDTQSLYTSLDKLSKEGYAAVDARAQELLTTQAGAITTNQAYAQALQEVEGAAKNAGTEIYATGKKTKDGGEEAASASDSFIALGAALTFVSAKASELIIGTTLVAGRVKELEILLEVTRQNAIRLAEAEGDLDKAAALNQDAVQAQVQAIEDLHLSGLVANETVAQMIRYNLDWTKASELAREAQDAATFANQDSSQALEGLIKGITTLQPRILRTYGIMVNLTEAYRKFADANDLIATELTQSQRLQAALNEVLAQAPTIAGAYEASLGSLTKQIRSVKTDVVNLSDAYGEFLEPALTDVVGGFRSVLQELSKLPSPTRAAISGFATTGSVMLTLTTGAATLLPVLGRLKTGFLGLANAVGISGTALAGLSIGIPVVVGVLSYLIQLEKAHIAEAAQIAATTQTYPDYVRSLEIAGEESRILTEQLWEQVRAQEAANQAAYAARILEEQRDMYTRLQQAINRFGGSLDKAFEAWKAGADNLSEFQLAIMADEEALYNLAIRLGASEDEARTWALAVSDWATVTIRAREEQEKLASSELPEYIEDATLKMTRLTVATDGYSDALQKIINMPFPSTLGEWLNPDDITKFLDDINDALDRTSQSMADAVLRRDRALEDLDTEYHNKSIDAWIAYQRELQDTEGDLEAFHAGTLNELLDLDRDYLQDRNDAWTRYQQDLADAERELQRDIEDASRARAQRLADLDREYAQDREDALRELNQDLEDNAEEHAQKLIDIEQQRQKSLLDLEQEYQDRLYAIQNLAQQRLQELQVEYDEKASDARLKHLRQALEYLRDEGIRVSDEYENILRRAFIGGEQGLLPFIVQSDLRDIYADLLEELAQLNDDQRWEEEDLSDDIDREQQQRLDDLEEWLTEEQNAIEQAYTERIATENERFAEEQEARRQDYERKLQDLQRALERERQETELNYQRKLDDVRRQAERERQAAAEEYARRLEDLEIEYNRERELIKTKLEEQNAAAREKYKDALEDLNRAKEREREAINTQYDRTIEDANAKLEQMVQDAAEEFGILPEAFQPTYRILKSDLHALLFSDADSLTNQWQEFIDNLRSRVFEARSPSRVMAKLAEDVLAGWEKGVGGTSLGDALTAGFDAQAFQANIQAALPAGRATVPMGAGVGNVSNTRTSNLNITAQYQHQSEASLRDDLSLWSNMMGVWG